MKQHKIRSLSLLALAAGLSWSVPAEAGFFDDLSDHIESKVSREVENRTNRKADKGVDAALDTVEEGAENAVTGKGKKSSSASGKSQELSGDNDAAQEGESASDTPRSDLVWSKFDFIPGDTVIFEDGPSVDEENGEFPSRWDLHKGNAEIAQFNDETVIMFLEHGTIVPYLKNSNKAYLPDVFTLEFDCYFEPKQYNKRYYIDFYDKKNQRKLTKITKSVTINANNIDFSGSNKNYPGAKRSNRTDTPLWRHISVAYTRGKLKIYMDDTRLINIPHLDGTPIGITISTGAEGKHTFIKNIRLAKGGVKYYDRVLKDGKIIVNGIRFALNKAELKPESMGPINKIYELMKKNPDLRFSVEGHTDSDGQDKANQTLSEKRAKAVAKQLMAMGIDANRLKTKGWGASKPLDSNASPEGRANNRRVEFVKF